MSEDLYGRSIKEQIQAELRENEDPYDFEYMNALAYFGLSAYATEEEARRVWRDKTKNNHPDNKENTSNEIGRINSNYDIIKKYFKHIKWKNSVRDKKIEIQTLMKNDITFSNIDSSLTALSSKLNGIYEAYLKKLELEQTLVGLEHLYNQYRNDLREEYKNVLMVYGIVELDPNVNTLQEFNNYLIKLLNQGKELFIKELDKEFNKYQNDDTYTPLLNIIRKLTEESKQQVSSTNFLNQTIKEDILSNLRTKINKLKESYNEIEGTLKYLQEFFAEIDNKELSSKSKSLLERLSNLKNEEELNQINNEVEPLETVAKEYEKKKEQEEIDNYIKQLISKYNNLIQKANPEELQELTAKLAKICELISKGKSLNKDLKYYQSIETILDEEKTKEEQKQVEKNKIRTSTSGIYILRNKVDEKFRWKSRGHFYLYHQDINKIESLRDNNNIFDRRTTPDFIEITSEELHENFISIEDFFAESAKINYREINYRGNSILFDGVEKGQDYYYFQQLGLRYWLDDKRNLINVKLKTFAITETIKIEEIEKDSPKEIQKLIDKIVAFVKKRSLRKQEPKSGVSSKVDHSYLKDIKIDKFYETILGDEYYYDNNTINGSLKGRGRGRNNDLNYD